MRVSRRALAFVALSVVLLLAGEAEAQTAVSYRFLEVLDAAGRPLAGVTVEAVGAPSGPQSTDERGAVARVPIYYGDFNTRRLRLSKPGYVAHEEAELNVPSHHHFLLESEVQNYDRDRIKVVMLKEPADDAERRAVEAERRRREFLRAVRYADPAAARELLRAGVSPDAADVYGVPAILWAAANRDAETIRALLLAGAEVRKQGQPGRRALLHYVGSRANKEVDTGLARALIKAGADLNAANREGRTVLMMADRSYNDELVKLLEKAGARRAGPSP